MQRARRPHLSPCSSVANSKQVGCAQPPSSAPGQCRSSHGCSAARLAVDVAAPSGDGGSPVAPLRPGVRAPGGEPHRLPRALGWMSSRAREGSHGDSLRQQCLKPCCGGPQAWRAHVHSGAMHAGAPPPCEGCAQVPTCGLRHLHLRRPAQRHGRQRHPVRQQQRADGWGGTRDNQHHPMLRQVAAGRREQAKHGSVGQPGAGKWCAAPGPACGSARNPRHPGSMSCRPAQGPTLTTTHRQRSRGNLPVHHSHGAGPRGVQATHVRKVQDKVGGCHRHGGHGLRTGGRMGERMGERV